MANTIKIKQSSVAAKVPLAGDLAQGELAINTTDQKVYSKDATTVFEVKGNSDDKLPLAGGTMTGDVSLGDNVKAKFGAGGDLVIKHDGSNSYISEVGTGGLKLRGNSSIDLGDTITGDFMFRAYANGYAKLYYSGDEKLATTSTGIDVTGTVTADGLTVDGSADIISSAADIDALQINDGTYGLDLGMTSTGGIIGTKNMNQSIDIKTYGSASTSTISNYTSNTKRFNIASNGDISFYEDTGTTPKFFWDASAESLGIGTSSPDAKADLVGGDVTGGLKISQDKTTSAFFILGADANETRITSSSYGGFKPLTVYTGGSERMRITSSGNVGIGTSSPLATLQIKTQANANAAFQNSTSVAGGLKINAFNDAGSASVPFEIDGSSLQFNIASVEKMRINSTGNVGIGTSSPSAKLDVELGADGVIAEFRGDDSDLIQIKGASNTIALDTRNTAGLTFEMQGAERLRITSAGNVGIGTISPARRLTIVGVDGSSGLVEGNSRTSLFLDNSAANYINLVSGNTYDGALFFSDSDNNNKGKIVYSHSSDSMYLSTNSTERMRITSAGNVGIGTTTPTSKLSIAVNQGTGTTDDFLSIQSASGLEQGGISTYNSGGYEQHLLFKTHTGSHSAASTERMRIDSSGNVGIGMTAPVSKLGVNGTFKIHHANGGTYTNLGSVMGNGTNTYIHVKMSRAYWADNGMDMFRITGYKPYGAYVESYMGNYAYGDAGNINSPYGQINANQGNLAAAANQYYTSEADGRYLVLVLYFPTNYAGLMIEHIQAGSSYGGYNGNNMAILTYVNAADATTKQW